MRVCCEKTPCTLPLRRLWVCNELDKQSSCSFRGARATTQAWFVFAVVCIEYYNPICICHVILWVMSLWVLQVTSMSTLLLSIRKQLQNEAGSVIVVVLCIMICSIIIFPFILTGCGRIVQKLRHWWWNRDSEPICAGLSCFRCRFRPHPVCSSTV